MKFWPFLHHPHLLLLLLLLNLKIQAASRPRWQRRLFLYMSAGWRNTNPVWMGPKNSKLRESEIRANRFWIYAFVMQIGEKKPWLSPQHKECLLSATSELLYQQKGRGWGIRGSLSNSTRQTERASKVELFRESGFTDIFYNRHLLLTSNKISNKPFVTLQAKSTSSALSDSDR